MQKKHLTFGRHILLDVWGAKFEVLNDLDLIKGVMQEAAHACGATIVKTAFQQFPIQGLSGVVVLAESHISVHTHPEHEYASFDIFTCGTTIDPREACHYIIDRLQIDRYNMREFIRGVPEGIEDAPEEAPHEIRLAQ